MSQHDADTSVQAQPEDTLSASDRRVFHIFALLTILLAGLLAYWNSLDGEFQFDDQFSVSSNMVLRSDDGTRGYLFTAMFRGFYRQRPLSNLTYLVNYRLAKAMGKWETTWRQARRKAGAPSGDDDRPLLLWALGGVLGRSEMDPRAYHVTNLLFHLLCSVLVYALVVRIFSLPRVRRDPWRPRFPLICACGVALLWAVHPLQVQAVTYITQRMVALSTLLILCVLHLGLLAAEHSGWRRAAFFASMCFFAVLAVLAKQIGLLAIPSLFLLWLILGFPGEKPLFSSWSKAIIAAAVFATFAVVTTLWQFGMFNNGGMELCWYFGGFIGLGAVALAGALIEAFHNPSRSFYASPGAQAAIIIAGYMLGTLLLVRDWKQGYDKPDQKIAKATGAKTSSGWDRVSSKLGSYRGSIKGSRGWNTGERFLSQGRVLCRYVSLGVWPTPGRLNADHYVAVSRDYFTPWTTTPAWLLVFLACLWALLVYQRAPLFSYGILFYFLHQSIEASFVNIELMFEHRTYLPNMGLLLVGSLLASRLVFALPAPRAARGAVLALIFVTAGILLGVVTRRRNEVWRTALGFWRDAAVKSPLKARPQGNVGAALGREGELLQQRAQVAWKNGKREKSRKLQARAKASFVEQIKYVKRALSLCRAGDPNIGTYYTILGNAYYKLQKFPEALKSYQAAERALGGTNVTLDEALGRMYGIFGDREHNRLYYEKSARYYNNAIAKYKYLREKHIRALDTRDSLANAWFGLGWVFSKVDRWKDAERCFKSALDVQSTHAEALNTLGFLLLTRENGDARTARASLTRLLTLYPGFRARDEIRSAIDLRETIDKYSGAPAALDKQSRDRLVGALVQLAGICRRVGLSQMMADPLNRALALEPAHADGLLLMAQLMLNDPQTRSRARPYLERFLSSHPTHPQAGEARRILEGMDQPR